MTKSEFENLLLPELEKNKANISEKFDQLIQNLSKSIVGIDIMIFTSQDGDGFFNIYANAQGPDLYVRQKEIEKFADLFEPKFTENGIEPYIPTVDDPFNVEFEVNDTIVDTVSKWIQINFANKNYPPGITFRVAGAEGYGTITPITLSE
jgi:hypothetical protein